MAHILLSYMAMVASTSPSHPTTGKHGTLDDLYVIFCTQQGLLGAGLLFNFLNFCLGTIGPSQAHHLLLLLLLLLDALNRIDCSRSSCEVYRCLIGNGYHHLRSEEDTPVLRAVIG